MSQKIHISGADTHISLGASMVHVMEFSLSIQDDQTTAYKRGVPDGTVAGKVSASGDISVDTANYNLLIDAARIAGSFQDLDAVDIVGYGETTTDQFQTTAYGCKLKMTDVLAYKDEGGEKLTHKVTFEVTDQRFVDINGVPYLSASRTQGLFG